MDKQGQEKKRSAFLAILDYGMLALYQVAAFVALVLPASIFYPFLKAVSAGIYYGRSRARRNLIRNISCAFPEVTDHRELNRIGRGAYSSLLLSIPDLIYLKRNPQRFLKGLEVEGMENLEAADAEGKGVLCLLVHHGNAHKHIFMVAIGRPYRLVMWHPETTPVPKYTRKLVDTTLAMGSGSDDLVIWVGPGRDTIKEVSESLTGGQRVGIPFDVSGKRVVELFGRPAALADGMGHWAFDAGCPMVPVTLLHTSNPYRCKLVIGERLRYEPTGERRADVGAIMQAAATAGEEVIRLAPEQWMSWFGLWHWWSQADEILAAKRANRV